MDEYNISVLSSSKDEWCCRLLNILSPLMIEGIKSILNEAIELCKKNNENKYLMTFQNLISRIPKWNPTIIETERKRIINKSGCIYLEELITCVHIIQLKLLTAVRVGQKQKKIDINILKLDDFLHKCYVNIARKVYKNVYLFERNIEPLQVQKNNRELDCIIKECILNTIRDSVPIESILRAYMDETIEEDVTEEIKEELVDEKVNTELFNKTFVEPPPPVANAATVPQTNETKIIQQSQSPPYDNNKNSSVTFDDNNSSVSSSVFSDDDDGVSQISMSDYGDGSTNMRININDEMPDLDKLDIEFVQLDSATSTSSHPNFKLNDNLLGDIEVLH
jgi:hypothetical protein